MSNTLNPAVVVPPAAQMNARVTTRSLLQAAGMLPVLILLALGFHFLGGHRFLSGQNLSIIAQQASINTVLASGMTFVILTGGIDLSVGSILLSPRCAAFLCRSCPMWPGLLSPPVWEQGCLLALLTES
ncbi:hypothetical protein [Asaia astilbis]|uniref:hypothetical protein n=1 Tax=Asaia astilbis TaxID=610244 RepID=UPI000AF20F08|nr:hypothetical protein [Asaia astilbis]